LLIFKQTKNWSFGLFFAKLRLWEGLNSHPSIARLSLIRRTKASVEIAWLKTNDLFFDFADRSFGQF
jgi:hypothetical protein